MAAAAATAKTEIVGEKKKKKGVEQGTPSRRVRTGESMKIALVKGVFQVVVTVLSQVLASTTKLWSLSHWSLTACRLVPAVLAGRFPFSVFVQMIVSLFVRAFRPS